MIRVRDREGQVHELAHHAAAAQRWPGMHLVPSISDNSLLLVLNATELAAWSQAVASVGRNAEAIRRLQKEARAAIQRGERSRVETLARGGPWSTLTGSSLDQLAELAGRVTRLPIDGMAAWRDQVKQNLETLGGLARDGARAGYTEWAAAVGELSTAYAAALEKAAKAMKNAAGDLGDGFGDFFEGILGLKPGLLLLVGGAAILGFYAFTPGGLALIGVGGKAIVGATSAGKAIGVASVGAVPGAFQAAASFIPGNAAASAAAAVAS